MEITAKSLNNNKIPVDVTDNQILYNIGIRSFVVNTPPANKLQDMNASDAHNQRIAKLTFASVYPMYVAKVEKKGRTKEELHQVITWLTGLDDKELQELIDEKVTFETFFQRASLHPNVHLITGMICGYRVEEIENPLTRQIRYLDKLVDELAKGKKMEKILR